MGTKRKVKSDQPNLQKNEAQKSPFEAGNWTKTTGTWEEPYLNEIEKEDTRWRDPKEFWTERPKGKRIFQ